MSSSSPSNSVDEIDVETGQDSSDDEDVSSKNSSLVVVVDDKADLPTANSANQLQEKTNNLSLQSQPLGSISLIATSSSTSRVKVIASPLIKPIPCVLATALPTANGTIRRLSYNGSIQRVSQLQPRPEGRTILVFKAIEFHSNSS